MEAFYQPANKRSPEFRFQTDGEFWIKGDSAAEDASVDYEPVIEWTRRFLENYDGTINLHIRLNHHNDSGSKYLLRLLRIIEEFGRAKNVVSNSRIYWYYEWWDEEIIFLGETLRSMMRFPVLMTDMYLHCMELAGQGDRVCPQLNHWQQLWKLIATGGAERIYGINRPRPPYAHWEWMAAMRREKMQLFYRHLRYANDQCRMLEVTDFLENLQEEDWFHGGDIGFIEVAGMEYMNGNMN